MGGVRTGAPDSRKGRPSATTSVRIKPPGPQLGNVLPPIHELPHDKFIAEIQRRYGGIPEVLLKEPELLAITLPILRADLAALNSYRYRAEARLECGISCFCGSGRPRIIRRRARSLARIRRVMASIYANTPAATFT